MGDKVELDLESSVRDRERPRRVVAAVLEEGESYVVTPRPIERADLVRAVLESFITVPLMLVLLRYLEHV